MHRYKYNGAPASSAKLITQRIYADAMPLGVIEHPVPRKWDGGWGGNELLAEYPPRSIKRPFTAPPSLIRFTLRVIGIGVVKNMVKKWFGIFLIFFFRYTKSVSKIERSI